MPKPYKLVPTNTEFGLTKKQHELLIYIEAYIAESGISPSFDEMKQAMGLNSKSGVHRLVHALEERGHITSLPNRARSIAIVTEAVA